MCALPRSTPFAEGVDSRGIDAFVRALEDANLETHSYMLLRHGKVIAEGWWKPYAPDLPHVLYSLSKSFCSTAAGLAISEGFFSLDDLVVGFFPDDLPEEVGPNLASMKVRHLLSMSCGQAEEAWRGGDNWVQNFLSQPVPFEPGTHFLYNSLGTYMVSAIVQKTTGQKVVDFLRPRLWEPLGITEATWEVCPLGINTGGWGLSLTTESIAKLGLLYIQDGVWEGKRILPEGWVADATRKHISNGDDPESDWAQGYGFQFWRCKHGNYRGDGAFGQYCIVMPEQDAVLAITGGGGDMQATLNLAWKHLLPRQEPWRCRGRAMLNLTWEHVLPALEGTGLVLAGPEGASEAGPFSGRYEGEGRTYTYAFDGQNAQIAWEGATLLVGPDWVSGRLEMGPGGLRDVAARGAWVDDNTYTVKICDIHSPASLVIASQFGDSGVEVSIRSKGVFGPDELPKFVGKRVAGC